MIRFILNNKEVNTDQPAGKVLLDFIRYHKHLTGTKIGCREGDCGACTVLIGEIKNNELNYKSFTSCLTPLGNIHGKHVVTIEGINSEGLNPVQQAMADEGATQCGFCTPGFVMSMAGFCLSKKEPSTQNSIAAIDGNICRCTGYKSIERAAARIAGILQQRKDETVVNFAIQQQIIPAYFSDISKRLQTILLEANGFTDHKINRPQLLGGGTDLYVHKHDEMKDASIRFLYDNSEFKGITKEGNKCTIGASATVTDLGESPLIKEYFPEFPKYQKLVSSTPIRNMATIGGNFTNASPIGDFTIFFLALDAQLIISDGKKAREIPLRKFYNGYKLIDLKPGEYIEKFSFNLPEKSTLFNFEKVSKRTHLDIASVNSAISLNIQNDLITKAGISTGGVGPTPLFLEKTSKFLEEKSISGTTISEALDIAQTEISPISDARGSAIYKRLLLNQLIKAHFLRLEDLKI